MKPQFKMKRSRVSDNIGILNYKRQRLIYDLENLRVSDDQLARPINARKHENITIQCKFIPDTLKDYVWNLINTDNTSSTSKIYNKIWETIRNSNFQVIKWINWVDYIYQQWIRWYHFKNIHPDRNTDVDMDIDYETSQHEYQYMDIDME